MTPRIREAQPADTDLLAQWMIAMAWETEHKHLDPATIRAGIAAGIADPAKARYFVAMQDAAMAGHETVGIPVGTLMLTTEWSDWRNGDWWWIQSVYVAPDHRRQGVYAALHRHAEQLARATPGVIGLRLYVEKDNANAQRTYSALGMHDAGYRIYEAEF
ncbi:GNAT family N-acetyltransferase [Lysobacter sp. CFH 32150]|uniref:GNAT family N-acetyltransferase n=1 Tax=Lysobacter sp. CFH 32150 TaxID=2927128 RepID=UPI001FA6E386|nr:GNAT family N-acetyltransferase [Lysobacter sp. CFH 32150]MCI4568063.1 GNAT family N-acetyltransferase [Lysobacter sp. CFH 32150]